MRRLSYVLLSSHIPVLHHVTLIVVITVIMTLNLVDCKSWFDEGYNTSGVYTINPDEQTPFEVRG